VRRQCLEIWKEDDRDRLESGYSQILGDVLLDEGYKRDWKEEKIARKKGEERNERRAMTEIKWVTG